MKRLVVLTEIIAPYRIPVFNALARQPEIKLHVIFLAESDAGLRQWNVYRDEIKFSYQVLPSWRKRLGGYNLLLNRGLGKALRKALPNVILCGGYNYLASWQAMRWARSHGVPFVLWIESTARDQRRGHAAVEFLKRRFLRNCDAFVVPGKSSFEYLKNYDVPEDAIFTAPNAVDIRLFGDGAKMVRQDAAIHRKTMHLPPRYFLFVGRLVKEKGIFDLLRGYGTLAGEVRKKIGLVYVGDGPERVLLEKMASEVAPGTVQFAGFAQREMLANYYGLAEMVILPTYTDTWGLVVNEAMASGLPVISTSAAGSTADLVDDGWNGRVVTAGDIAQLASAMHELAGDENLRTLMGQRSRERILRYSPEACAAGMADATLASEVAA